MTMREFIAALPKTETHLHIEGALPYELLHAWQPDQFAAPPPYFHAEDFRFSAFSKFDEVLLGHALPWFTSAERYHESSKVVFARHVAQNVRYVETSFHLPVTGFIGVPGKEIIAAIRSAVPRGLEVRVFAGMLRTDYAGPLRDVIDGLADWDELDGVDLHGYEQTPTEPWTAPVWRRLRSAGKITKVHAGEFDGAARVREAIEVLGSNRIQHGVRAIEDSAVLTLARDRDVTFDVCPISNVRLGVVSSMQAHPLREILAAGVRCTVSTDDPLVFGNSVTQEYEALARDLRFTHDELARVAKNGFEVAQLRPDVKRAFIAEIDRLAAAAGNSHGSKGRS